MHKGPASVAQLGAFDAIIDVRSPAEFAEDHVPGAINCPALDDRQRAEIGTLYKQVSPFEARKRGAAYVAENIAHALRNRFMQQPREWRPLVMCWRGGQRSGAFVLVMRQVGWDATQLAGGYKRFRQHVVESLPALVSGLRLCSIAGSTGSGKTRLLHALAEQGGQVLDLEALAAHKGSVLGALPERGQPTQKGFETALWDALRCFDPARPVFVEAESRRIGKIQLPDPLDSALREASVVELEVPLDARIGFLQDDYRHCLERPDWLKARLDSLRELHGHAVVDGWHQCIDAGAFPALVRDLLARHYDPLYRRNQRLGARRTSLALPDLAPASVAQAASRLLGREPAAA